MRTGCRNVFPRRSYAVWKGWSSSSHNKDYLETHDWSGTPGRYVGVAPEEEDEDFDFEETLREIHLELADLNAEAAELAAKIAENFESLAI